MVSRVVMVNSPMVSNKGTVNKDMANSRAMALPMEAILNRDTEADTEDLPRARMVDISRLPRDMAGLVLVEVRPWVWEEACWVG